MHISWLPDNFADSGGTAVTATVPFSEWLARFLAQWCYRCYAEEVAFSIRTQEQRHVGDLAEYKRVEPAHCALHKKHGERKTCADIPPSLLYFAYSPCFLFFT